MPTHAAPTAIRASPADSRARESVPVRDSCVSSRGVCVSRENGAGELGAKTTGDDGAVVVGLAWEPGGSVVGTAPDAGTLVEVVELLVVTDGGRW
jgi:hypothetical protein